MTHDAPPLTSVVVSLLFALGLAACGTSDPDAEGQELPPALSDPLQGSPIVVDVIGPESMWLDPLSGHPAASLDVDASLSLLSSTLPVFQTGQVDVSAVAAERLSAIGEVFGLSGLVEEGAADGNVDVAGSFRLVDERSSVELVLFELGSGIPFFVLEGDNGGPLPIEAPADLSEAMTELLDVVGLSDEVAVTELSEGDGVSAEFGLRASFRPPPYDPSPVGRGLRGGAEWVLAVDGSGALLGAAGPAVAPVEVGQVATVGRDEAIRRLAVMFATESFGPVLTVPPQTTQVPAEPLPPMQTTTLVPGPPTQSTPTTPPTTPPTSTPSVTTLLPFVETSPPMETTTLVPGLSTQSTTNATTTVMSAPVATSEPPEAISSTTAPEPLAPPPPPSTWPEVAGPPVAAETLVRSTRIVEVRTELRLYFGSLDASLLLPHHVFVAEDGVEYPVLAVAPQHLRFDPEQPVVTAPLQPPEPVEAPPTTMTGTVPTPQSMPTLLTDDGTPVTIPMPPVPGSDAADYSDVLNAVLVGRPLGEVVSTLEASGWTVRLIDDDQPNATLTADLQAARANVGHRGDIVTSVAVDRWSSVPAGTGATASQTTTTTTTTGPGTTLMSVTTTQTSI